MHEIVPVKPGSPMASWAGRSPASALARLSVLLGLALVATGAQALGASVSTALYSMDQDARVNLLPNAACGSSLDRGFSSEISSLGCTHIYRQTSSQVTLLASATAPSPGQYAELKALAQIDTNTNTGNAPAYNQWQYNWAIARAQFGDFIRLDPQQPVSAMRLTFQLSGTLDLNDPHHSAYPLESLASADFRVSVGSGNLYPDGSFGAFEPYASLTSSVVSTLKSDGSQSTVVVPYDSINAAKSALSLDPNGDITLTLGPSFFSNPQNQGLSLNLELISTAKLFAYVSNPGESLSSVADYSHTLRMVSLEAFDPNGTDVSAQAVLGFASASLPAVPEPATATLTLLGLAGLAGWAQRRARRASHTPPANIKAQI